MRIYSGDNIGIERYTGETAAEIMGWLCPTHSLVLNLTREVQPDRLDKMGFVTLSRLQRLPCFNRRPRPWEKIRAAGWREVAGHLHLHIAIHLPWQLANDPNLSRVVDDAWTATGKNLASDSWISPTKNPIGWVLYCQKGGQNSVVFGTN